MFSPESQTWTHFLPKLEIKVSLSSCSEIPDVRVFIFFLPPMRKKLPAHLLPKQLNWCGLGLMDEEFICLLMYRSIVGISVLVKVTFVKSNHFLKNIIPGHCLYVLPVDELLSEPPTLRQIP
jgi:hypothetical protein